MQQFFKVKISPYYIFFSIMHLLLVFQLFQRMLQVGTDVYNSFCFVNLTADIHKDIKSNRDQFIHFFFLVLQWIHISVSHELGRYLFVSITSSVHQVWCCQMKILPHLSHSLLFCHLLHSVKQHFPLCFESIIFLIRNLSIYKVLRILQYL